MKELSIEQKAKAYDEAIERGKQIQNTPYTAHWDVMKDTVEHILPELKENRDEKIRKSLRKCFEWLRDDARWTDVYGSSFEEVFSWLEKQDEQMSTDNAKLRFKVGDWVVYNRNYHDCSREIIQVYHIRDGRYYFNDNIHFSWSTKECDEKSHLWTIQDAKDGDVLAGGEQLFLFKRMNTSNSFYAYCNYHFIGHDNLSAHDCSYSIDNIYPATKEQRDLLFQKMKEAGYEWDAEHKQLKKIEKKPAWSEEDEKKQNYLIALLQNSTMNNPAFRSVNEGLEEWLKSLKDRVLSQPQWKPSDGQMKILNEVLNFAANHESPHWNDYIFGTLNNLIGQLKKLK